jgi:hypothetical protein
VTGRASSNLRRMMLANGVQPQTGRRRSTTRPADHPAQQPGSVPETGPVAGSDRAAAARVLLVDNARDTRAVTAYLAQHPARQQRCRSGRVLIRPTPAGLSLDPHVLGLDLLTALGKNPNWLRQVDPDLVWQYARAWSDALGVTEIILDRAHQVTEPVVRALAELAGPDRRLWLIWSSDRDPAPLCAGLNTELVLRQAVRSVTPDDLTAALPVLPYDPAPPYQAPTQDWRTLPTADFTTFRAACRRHLSPHRFAALDATYTAAADTTDTWCAEYHDTLTTQPEQIGGTLAAWLRDHQIGPCINPSTALITLRATQAALLPAGIVLRFDPRALGTDAARRLPGDLHNPSIISGLLAHTRTTDTAATALSLHLNQPPWVFDCWRLRHVAPDGSHLTAPETHHHRGPGHAIDRPGGGLIDRLDHLDRERALSASSNVAEIACLHPIHLPRPAWPLLAAHRAYRLAQPGVTDDDPLFTHPVTDRTPPHPGLREAINRTLLRVFHPAPWMHHDPCRQGPDIGQHPRAQGWLVQRGLSVHPLDPTVTTGLHRSPAETVDW